MKNPRKLILSCFLSPGDILCISLALESIHTLYPGEFLTDIRSPVPDIFENNPRITPLSDSDPEVTTIPMEYPQIQRSNQTLINFASCYTEFLGEQIGKPLYATVNRPMIYLTDAEKSWMTMPQEHFTHGRKVPYGVLVAGTKCDYTIKQYPIEHYQEIVIRTLGLIQWVQIGEKDHNHKVLDGVISVVGQTTHRALHRLVYHSSIGLGPVTYLLHLCAAFEKPYIYLAGGREPVTFINYPKMHTLHTIGALPCCRDRACWKSRVVPLGDGDRKDNELCESPVVGLKSPVARCMSMLEPEDVVRIVRRLVH